MCYVHIVTGSPGSQGSGGGAGPEAGIAAEPSHALVHIQNWQPCGVTLHIARSMLKCGIWDLNFFFRNHTPSTVPLFFMADGARCSNLSFTLL